jgi:hypothetical protein
MLFSLGILIFTIPDWAQAHIKWFVEFDVSDPPFAQVSKKYPLYYSILIIISLLGISLALFLDRLWYEKWHDFIFIKTIFSDYDDIALNIARIGTGVFFVAVWLISGISFAPELLNSAWYIPYIQLMIVFSLLSKRTTALAGLGILTLYTISIYRYGFFHLLDYLTFIGLALYLILSSLQLEVLKGIRKYRLNILYYSLIFSFLWSAIEKLAYPEWFYGFLEKHHFLTMGFDVDFFIVSAAFVEFTLFFLLLVSRNGIILLAFLINLLIIVGNLYFGKMDAVGHFPVNFILAIFLIKGALPNTTHFFKYSTSMSKQMIKVIFLYLATLLLFLSSYYAMHKLLY